MPYLNKALQRTFWAKLIDPALEIIPAISVDSKILTPTMSSMLYLTSQQYQHCTSLPILYTASNDGDDFDNLVEGLRFYDGPILILIKHLVENKTQSINIMDDTTPELESNVQNGNTNSRFPKSMVTANKNIKVSAMGKSAIRYNNGTAGEITTSRFNIIGAFVSCKLQDGGNYFGDSDCYLFS